ncbi:helix-turn-helix domain-containing protein [Paratractidigestivibacter faecalis]|uniref:Helix-turn-helix domain-containing protein n=1 Tax=Paratractidigestivibacter faecalis TaxID=2292441 RepID=A0ABV1IFU3_9ACTN
MNLDEYRQELINQGVTAEDFAKAREATAEKIEAYELAQERKRRRITQTQVARSMGVGQSRVSEIENGDLGSARLDTIRRYAKSLGAKLVISFEWPDKTIEIG